MIRSTQEGGGDPFSDNKATTGTNYLIKQNTINRFHPGLCWEGYPHPHGLDRGNTRTPLLVMGS